MSKTFTSNVYAQKDPSKVWHEGTLILKDKEKIEGRLKYNLDKNLVQLANNNKVKAFSARQILYFNIYDKVLKKERTFYALPYEVRNNYKTPILFEILYENAITVLGREYLEERQIAQPNYYFYTPPNYITQYRLRNELYFLNREGKITKFDRRKKSLLSYMVDYEKRIKAFLKENRINLDKDSDVIKVVSYYNSLINS